MDRSGLSIPADIKAACLKTLGFSARAEFLVATARQGGLFCARQT